MTALSGFLILKLPPDELRCVRFGEIPLLSTVFNES